ncbi:MAG: methyltransferase domain-containing protein [Candidatus Acidiferrales bacterium]
MQFQDAEKYAAYLKTPAGRLRSELAWKNLRRFLPLDASKRRALDLGGGTGSASVELARMGYEVVLLDSSEQMLRIARQQAEACGVTPRISFCHAETGQLRELFAAESFDVVVCHNLLEYSEDPATTVCDIARVLRMSGVLSVLVRNRAGEVLKDAVKSRDWKLATADLTADTVVDTLYGNRMRLFVPTDLQEMLARGGLEVVAEHGVRVFSDYLDLEAPPDATYSQIFELESTLGARPEFFAIARYIQLIARRSRASASEVTGS